MIRRRRHARFLSASAAGSDTDALQTDVMRFMSIIGLCLMAVFALVQGIPVQETGKPVQAVQAARVWQEILTQQQQLRELQAELQALKSEKNWMQRVLTDIHQHLEQARQALVAIEQDSEQKEHNLAELRGRLLKTQQQLDQNHDEIAAVKRQLRQKTDPPVIKKQAPAAPPEPIARTIPAKQGFTLRFASDGALDRLVTAGGVSLYGMVDQQAWRLSMDTGQTVVTQVPFPGWFHEMSAVTVPAHYIHSLGQSGAVWGVQLPAATKTAIASLTRGQQGGVLVIRSDGQVVLED
jgi:Skp family chaperone for outer membrane proteins